MSMSKVFAHRTNASRAARAAGIAKAPLIAVAGGYCFELHDATRAASATEPVAPAGWDTVEGGAKTVEQWEADAPLSGVTRAQLECESGTAYEGADEPFDPNEPDVPDARAAHTVVNGAPREMTNEECAAISRTEASLERIDTVLAVAEADKEEADRAFADISSYASERVCNGTRKPKRLPKAAKAPKPAKRTKAPRKARAVVEGPTKRGTKAYADRMAARRRAGMNKRGITELVIKEIRTRWTPTSALLKMTGWQPTTLRGVLSLYAKKEGIEIKGETRDGERYYLVAR